MAKRQLTGNAVQAMVWTAHRFAQVIKLLLVQHSASQVVAGGKYRAVACLGVVTPETLSRAGHLAPLKYNLDRGQEVGAGSVAAWYASEFEYRTATKDKTPVQADYASAIKLLKAMDPNGSIVLYQNAGFAGKNPAIPPENFLEHRAAKNSVLHVYAATLSTATEVYRLPIK